MITGVRRLSHYAGARSLQEFHDRAEIGVQTPAGYTEGRRTARSDRGPTNLQAAAATGVPTKARIRACETLARRGRPGAARCARFAGRCRCHAGSVSACCASVTWCPTAADLVRVVSASHRRVRGKRGVADGHTGAGHVDPARRALHQRRQVRPTALPLRSGWQAHVSATRPVVPTLTYLPITVAVRFG
jgi:hypothetical protein